MENSKALIVTGGSRGIGAAIAKLAATQGYAVAINYSRDVEGATKVAREIETAGGRAAIIRGDVSREADVVALFEAAEAFFGPVGALVNNAGITGPVCRLEALDEASLARVFAINVFGVFLCSREAVRRMSIKKGGAGGSIVNVSSRAAEIGGGGEWVHYAASKGAVDSFTIGLAREVAAEGIRVNAVSPGLIETNIHAASGQPDRVARMAPNVPMKRGGSAEEVANGVLWLLSPEASYITGAILPIGGGR